MKIISNIHPITIDPNPSKQMVQFGEMFLGNQLIVKLRDSISKILPIPNGGYPLDKYIGKDFDEIDVLNKQFFPLLTIFLPKTLLHQFNLTDTWLKFVAMAIFFDAIIDLNQNPGFLDNEPIVFMAGKKNIAAKLHDFEGKEVVALIIPFHSSKQQYHDWIDAHWQEIESSMDHHLAKTIPFLDFLQNYSIGVEIEGLRKQKKTFKQIADILSTKYPHDERLCDYGQIKVIHKRYVEKQGDFSSGLNTLFSAVGNV